MSMGSKAALQENVKVKEQQAEQTHLAPTPEVSDSRVVKWSLPYKNKTVVM